MYWTIMTDSNKRKPLNYWLLDSNPKKTQIECGRVQQVSEGSTLFLTRDQLFNSTATAQHRKNLKESVGNGLTLSDNKEAPKNK